VEHVTATTGSLLTLLAFLVPYTALAAAAGRRFGVRLRSDEALALGVAMICAVCVAGYCASRVLTAVSTRVGGTVVSVPLTLVALALAALPVVAGLVIVRRRHRAGTSPRPPPPALRAAARWALPATLLVVLATAATLHFETANTFRTDAGWRTDAVKELVWSDSAGVGRSPPLPAENEKYTGYLVARATVTAVTGDRPWRPNLAWIAICAAAMAAAVFALARNLGLGSVPALAGLVAVPLLGGDAFRFGHVGDARALAATMTLTGLALLARGLSGATPRRSLLGAAGAVCGLAALVHVQYLVIVASLLVPAVVVALLGRRWLEGMWWRLGVATAVACAVMVLAIPQALSFGTSSIAEAAAERSATEPAALLASGQAVWPPRKVTLDVNLDVPILYLSPHLYILHPTTLTDAVWGDRTAPLLVLAGAAAALLLVRRRRAGSLLAVLMLGSLAAPLLILFDPLIFPVFAKYFATYRSEYVGFELAFLGVAAIVALLRPQPAVAVPLAGLAVLAGLPVVDATRDGYASLHRFDELMRAPDQREWRQVETDTRFTDLLLAKRPLYDAAGALGRRRATTPEAVGIPSPFDPSADPEAVRRALAKHDGRVVILFSGGVPDGTPLRQLIDAGVIRRARRPPTQDHVVYRQVDLGRPAGNDKRQARACGRRAG
jgi:hypothetical protein